MGKAHKPPLVYCKPSAEWKVNKMQMLRHLQSVLIKRHYSAVRGEERQLYISTFMSSRRQPKRNAPYHWTVVQVDRSHFLAANSTHGTKNWILVDIQSSANLFRNPNLVTDINKS